MELKVKISPSSSDPFDLANVAEFRLDRSMGQSIRWSFTLNFSIESRLDKLQHLVKAILAGKCDIQGFIGEDSISPKMRITGVEPFEQRGSNRLLVIEGTFTKSDRDEETFDPTSDPFTPRRRVLHAKDLYELVKQFDHIVKIPDSIKFDLTGITFPDEDKAVLIQDGVSDWEYLNGLLYRFSMLNQWENPLVLSGSAAEDHTLWTIVWGSELTYIDKGEVENRSVELNESDDGHVHFSFETLQNYSLGPDATSSNLPSVQFSYPQRTFTIDHWKEWSVKDVPLFLVDGDDKRMAYRVRDYIGVSGTDNTVHWKTDFSILSAPGKVLPQKAPGVLKPWSGIGIVVENSPKSPWLKVKLPSFQDEKEEDNHVNVRLTTPYSGNGGNNGLHLLPEKDTHVLISWSGAWDESIALLANVRMDDMELEHPSFKLEKPTTWQMDSVSWNTAGMSLNTEDVSWNAGNVNHQSDNVDWNAKNFAVSTDGNHSVTVKGDSKVEATGKAEVTGTAVNVDAKTSVAINGKTDVKINC